jgi:hypothetical protein
MISGHRHNMRQMLLSPRCGAKTRLGKPGKSPAVQGKKRCRIHSGARGSGAPRGHKNALKRGPHIREARRSVRTLMRESRKPLQTIE